MIKKASQVSYQIATHEGDTLKFLKRLHVITSDGIVVQPSGDYAAKTYDILEVPVGKQAKTPCTKEVLLPDSSPELSPAKAGKYRSAVEIAMYMSQDRVDIAFRVRILSQRLKSPTVGCWRHAQRLCANINGTSSYHCWVCFYGNSKEALLSYDLL